jgi:hypothetical protein
MLTEERSTGEQGGSEGRSGPVLRTDELTLEEAVEVLNEHSHRGSTTWFVWPSREGWAQSVGNNTSRDDLLESFEVLAIAARYRSLELVQNVRSKPHN